MGRFKIEQKAFGKIEFYSGSYTSDVSETDDEAQIRDFDFTVAVESDLENDMVEVTEIIWSDEEPPALDIAEDTIKENFLDQLHGKSKS
jgi:hypothetical protein